MDIYTDREIMVSLSAISHAVRSGLMDKETDKQTHTQIHKQTDLQTDGRRDSGMNRLIAAITICEQHTCILSLHRTNT